MSKSVAYIDVYDNGVVKVKFRDGSEQVVTSVYYHDAVLVLDDEQQTILNKMKTTEIGILSGYYEPAIAKLGTVRVFIGKEKPKISNDKLLDVVKVFLNEVNDNDNTDTTNF